jgi:DNA repair protein RecO (recombination protein O)
MRWTDEAILLSVARYGETSALVSVLTREHGRHGGLVRGGGSKAARGALQPGNRLTVTWQARLADHLGHVSWELASATGTRWLDDPLRLAGLTAVCALAEACLAEREPHSAVFEGLAAVLAAMDGEGWPGLVVLWELGLLGELGFGLDLSCCAVSGTTDDLVYVSPKSGRAVSRAAGLAYHDKLLPLPGFLLDRSLAGRSEVLTGLGLTGYFLDRHVLGPHGRTLPAARARLVERLKREPETLGSTNPL